MDSAKRLAELRNRIIANGGNGEYLHGVHLEGGKLVVNALENGLDIEHYDGLLGGNYSGRTELVFRNGVVSATRWYAYGNQPGVSIDPNELMERIEIGIEALKI